MLMLRIMLATVCYRFGSWRLVLKLNFCSDFEHKVWSRFWSWSSGKILKLKFGKYFGAEAWLRLWSLILVKILKLGLVHILNFKFYSQNPDVWLRFWSWVTLVSWTQHSGTSCLWQCFRFIQKHHILMALLFVHDQNTKKVKVIFSQNSAPCLAIPDWVWQIAKIKVDVSSSWDFKLFLKRQFKLPVRGKGIWHP